MISDAPAAGIELLAICSSVSADDRLATESIDALTDWHARYSPAFSQQGSVIRIVSSTIADGAIDAPTRHSLYRELEESLPLQLRRSSQRERRMAEYRAARRQGQVCSTLPFDFIVAGAHLSVHKRVIANRVNVGDAVRIVRYASAHHIVVVELLTGECIGFVPNDDTAPIKRDLAASRTLMGSVKKILSTGRYQIPVVGLRVRALNVQPSAARPLAKLRELLGHRSSGEEKESSLDVVARAVGARLRSVSEHFR